MARKRARTAKPLRALSARLQGVMLPVEFGFSLV